MLLLETLKSVHNFPPSFTPGNISQVVGILSSLNEDGIESYPIPIETCGIRKKSSFQAIDLKLFTTPE